MKTDLRSSGTGQKGQLNKTQSENLNQARLSVAKRYAQQKRFADAISLLKQILKSMQNSLRIAYYFNGIGYPLIINML